MNKENNKKNQYEVNHSDKQTDPDPLSVTSIKGSQLRTTDHSVFHIDDSFYRTRTPKASHWSIAWSDLMMTMFILFLTLFVYQLANRDFLKETKGSVVAGSTIEIPTPINKNKPFFPITPILSDKKGIVIKKATTIFPPDNTTDQPPALTAEGEKLSKKASNKDTKDTSLPPQNKQQLDNAPLISIIKLPTPPDNKPIASPLIDNNIILEPGVISPQVQDTSIAKSIDKIAEKTDNELITKIYDLSKYTLTKEKLDKFATVELIPDKTVRIILTGDLLFNSGKATLSENAKISLGKLAPIIKQTPYMINVIGHTDSVPMHSAEFPTNWELSITRASRVARFLIENIGIPGEQFKVSGYAYHRPVQPNSNDTNKKANRRVEIILSMEPPPAKFYENENIFN